MLPVTAGDNSVDVKEVRCLFLYCSIYGRILLGIRNLLDDAKIEWPQILVERVITQNSINLNR